MRKRTLIKNCIVDGRLFHTYIKTRNYHHHHGRGGYLRPNGSKTCSRKCARLYLYHRKEYLKKG